MYVLVKNITPKNHHLIRLEDLPVGSAFKVNDCLYMKPEVIDFPYTPLESLIPVINIQNMYVVYYNKDGYVQPVRIREAEIKYDDLYGEDV